MPWTEGEALTPTNLNATSGQYFDVRAFGGLGLGSSSSTIDTAAVKAAEAARVAAGGGILYFPPGNYWLTPATASSLVTIGAPGKWLGAGLSLTTFVYAGGSSLDTGTDFAVNSGQTTSVPAGLGVLNVMTNGVSLDNFAIDCQTKAQYAVCYQQAITQGHLNISVFSTKDKSFGGVYATWSGLNYCLSANVPSQSLVASALTPGQLAKGIGGHLFRSDCPVQDGTDTIIAHVPVSALVIGGSTPILEGAGGNSRTFCTGSALVFPNSGYNMTSARLDSVGVISGLVGTPGGDTNYYTTDIFCHDFGNTVQETSGTGFSPSYGFGNAAPGSGESQTMGHIFKTGAVAAWYHYNVTGSDTTAPNVWLSGGSVNAHGFAHFEKAHLSLRTTNGSGNSSNLSDKELAIVAVSATSAQIAVRSGNTTYLFNAVATAL